MSGDTDGAVCDATLALVTLPEPVANPLGDVLSLGELERLWDCVDGELAQNRRQGQQQPGEATLGLIAFDLLEVPEDGLEHFTYYREGVALEATPSAGILGLI